MPNLKFNISIYKKEAVRAAISAFSGLARFKVKKKKKYINISVTVIDPDFKDVLLDEFGNYVLGETKKCLLS